MKYYIILVDITAKILALESMPSLQMCEILRISNGAHRFAVFALEWKAMLVLHSESIKTMLQKRLARSHCSHHHTLFYLHLFVAISTNRGIAGSFFTPQ